MDNILASVKKLVGVAEEEEAFDEELVTAINSVFQILWQLGVGPKTPFRIKTMEETWSDFTGDDERLEAVRSYMGLKVRMLFDPLSSSTHMQAAKEEIEEYEYRLRMIAEGIFD